MRDRVARLQDKLAERELDAVLITEPHNRRYISGFTGTAGYVLVGRREAVFLTDFRYVEQARAQVSGLQVVRHGAQVTDTLRELLQAWGARRVGFEQEHVSVGWWERLRAALAPVELVGTSGLVEESRMVKDEGELARIRRAAAIADQAFRAVLDLVRPGVRERDLAVALERTMQDLGASGPSFEIIVASGWRSALPHGVASDKLVEKGDLVTFDFGCVYEGYCSDLTRTVGVGFLDEPKRRMYEVVEEAQRAALAAIRPGMTGREADAVARSLIEEAGFGEAFGHSLGHGLGLAIHESPRLAAQSEEVLRPGMVVTVEPGVYVPGVGGVRIEDDVVITPDGCARLTFSPKELLIL
ncbi:MAG: Xaa-Pro peptidase family protein [Alicyclobacillaceae bacterium]|nr:Xaa-Pro peptidase family protein [Alicyclobacillaceae bacterium]